MTEAQTLGDGPSGEQAPALGLPTVAEERTEIAGGVDVEPQPWQMEYTGVQASARRRREVILEGRFAEGERHDVRG